MNQASALLDQAEDYVELAGTKCPEHCGYCWMYDNNVTFWLIFSPVNYHSPRNDISYPLM